MKQIALSKIKDDLSKYLRKAEREEIVITRHGKPAGILIGFSDEDDWFDYRLERDPRFLERIAIARASARAGKGIRLEDLEAYLKQPAPNSRGESSPNDKRRKRSKRKPINDLQAGEKTRR